MFLKGTDVTAQNSVPAAIYSFLRTTKDKFSKMSNQEKFRETLLYAISLGGDTDTVATMACAIAGAVYSIESIPQNWIRISEGTRDAEEQADNLFQIVQSKTL